MGAWQLQLQAGPLNELPNTAEGVADLHVAPLTMQHSSSFTSSQTAPLCTVWHVDDRATSRCSSLKAKKTAAHQLTGVRKSPQAGHPLAFNRKSSLLTSAYLV